MKRIFFALLLTAIFAAPAFSQMRDKPMNPCKDCNLKSPEMAPMDMMGDMMGMCIKNADKIGLTDAQKKKITPLHLEMQKKRIRFQADLKIAQLEMKEIMEPKDFDLDKAIAAINKTEKIKTAYHLEMLKTMKAVRSVFTDEQYKKLRALMPMRMGAGMPARMKHKP
ncbi:MAG: Spy/CpxP family protein refolding chaperone [Geobacteraceae bacterium]|nr:Spy/CpxP family protein refolding chaperone [Geobacteraceae bacterium]